MYKIVDWLEKVECNDMRMLEGKDSSLRKRKNEAVKIIQSSFVYEQSYAS